MPLDVQALWFTASAWSRADAETWCREHDFAPVEWRTRREDDDEATHHIAVIFQPDAAVEGSFRTLADEFPDGVSATVAERKAMPRHVVKAGIQSEISPWTFIMSSEDTDRDGDVIVQEGIDLRGFRANPVALFAHDHTQPIGTWENVRIEGRRLLGDLKLAALGTSTLIDTLHKLIEQRILRAVSIGFAASQYEPLTKGGLKFLKTVLLEGSLVAVPANSGALRIKALQVIPDDLSGLLLQPDGAGKGSPGRARQAGAAPRQESARMGLAHKDHAQGGGKPMQISQQIVANEARIVAIKDGITELKDIIEKDEGDGPGLDDEQQERLDALVQEQDAVLRKIEVLKKAEASLGPKAVQVNGAQSARLPAVPAAKEAGGSLLVKSITAALIARFSDRPVTDVIEEVYETDNRVKAVSKAYLGRKSLVDAADTTTAGWAAELVRNDIQGFMEELRAVSVYAGLARYGRSLDFGMANSITIPRRNRTAQNKGAQIGGSWVGEGGVIPVKKMALASQTLARYKLAVISAFTNELMQQSVPNIEGLVRDAILEDTALVLDTSLLDASAIVVGVRPAGLQNGVTPQGSAGDTAADIVTDIKYLLGQMAAINGAMPVLIMNSTRLLGLSTVTMPAGGFMFRDEISQGRLLGIPVVHSTTVDADEVIIVDAGSFVAANAAPAFSISDEVTLVMANADATAPTQAGDASNHTGGGLGVAEQVKPDGGIVVVGSAGLSTTGYQAQSMWQQNQTAVRMILPASWGLIRTGAVAVLNSVSW